MRDLFKDRAYFEDFICQKHALIAGNEFAFSDEEEDSIKAKRARFRNFGFRLEILTAKYSKGESLDVLRTDLIEIIRKLPNETDPICTKPKIKIDNHFVLSDHYLLEPYGRFLRVLSLAHLLEIPLEFFKIIASIFRRDMVSDKLLNLILNAKGRNFFPECDETYSQNQSEIVKRYTHLRKAIELDDSDEIVFHLRQYLKEDFYHKHSGFFDFHKSKIDLYYGYWSFEAAAISDILGLSSSYFSDTPYFPSGF